MGLTVLGTLLCTLKGLSSPLTPYALACPKPSQFGSFVVKTIQFHTEGTFWMSRLTVQSDALQVVPPALHPIIPLDCGQPPGRVVSISSSIASSSPTEPQPRRHPRLARHLRPLSSAWPLGSGEKHREASLESGSPGAIPQGLRISGKMGNFFKHQAVKP